MSCHIMRDYNNAYFKILKIHKIKTDFIQLHSVVPLIILLLFEMVQNF